MYVAIGGAALGLAGTIYSTEQNKKASKGLGGGYDNFKLSTPPIFAQQVEMPQMAADEKMYRDAIKNALYQGDANAAQLEGAYLQNARLVRNQNGEYQFMPYDQYYKGLSADQQQYEDLMNMQRNRLANAYNGKMEVPEYIKQYMAENSLLNDEAMSRSLGTNWRASTAGIQSAKANDLNRLNILSQLQEKEIAQGNTNLLNSMNMQMAQQTQRQGLLDSAANRPIRFLSAYNQALQPWQQDRQMILQTNMANASNNLQAQMATASNQLGAGNANMNYGMAQQNLNAQQNAGLMSGIGSLAGAGMGYYNNQQLLNAMNPQTTAPSTGLAPLPSSSVSSFNPYFTGGGLFGNTVKV